MTTKQTLPDNAALVLICKRPALGHGKQRLAAQIGVERALNIAEHLLDCALEDLRGWSGPVVIAPDQSDACDWAIQQAPQALCLAQTAGNLGERINNLDHSLRGLGHRQLLYIGSDAPALTPADYQRVHAALGTHDTVLVAARDGGVVLMASKLPWPELAALPWSTPELGLALADACRRVGHSVALCGESFDIDEQADLPLAAQALADDPRAARRRLLQTLNNLEGLRR
ncbi:TIGR04282 family arsenosugar biosynthesis glycosyltransferase [Stutzerimonas xanthomarina]|uniref:TIGR04282 family arsenosugar biosynthesis glycosyltransferase n=1 Tax=Stutzerimonas xanthomarina TaxID=271420 RepID=UPI003AA92A65